MKPSLRKSINARSGALQTAMASMAIAVTAIKDLASDLGGKFVEMVETGNALRPLGRNTLFILNFPGRYTVQAVINDTSKDIVVLRTGERGLLMYEAETRRFAFAKWDAVKGFDWPRQPIL